MTERVIRPIPDRPPWEDFRQAGAAPWEEYQAPAGHDMPRLLGGAGATMGAAEPESLWEAARRRWNEAIYGPPERADVKATGVGLQPTPAEMVEAALTGGAILAGGATMGGLAAHPLRTAMTVGAGYAGEKAAHEVGEVAEAMGAPEGTANVAGVVGGLAAGGRTAAGGRLARAGRAAAAEAETAAGGLARRVAHREGAAAATDRAAAQSFRAEAKAREIEEWIVSQRKGRGLSGAQLTEALRREHGIPVANGEKMVQDALEARFLVGAKPKATVHQFPARPAAPAEAPAAGPKAAQAQEVQEKIMALRQQGLSGAQIASSLRQLYGIPPSQGQKMIDMVIEASGGGR